ncbi:MAG: prolipoprotein diacylglyceryl transferase [Deltaproteobacteria bacterium]|nr:prolipoprotein diacylglyceryl transferase [Deltaproteobacteria bacterium]
MLQFPRMNPNLIEIGPFQIRWYGLMYVLGFLAAYFLISRQSKARDLGLQGAKLQDFIFFLALGLIVGARLGYVLFYQYSDFAFYLQHPLEIIAVWHGGMSFHGGLIGALAAGILFCRLKKLPVWEVADTTIVAAPIGLGLGRLGNFINGELYGRVADLPWAMVFPGAGPEPRHPSQLYEAALEGVLLFVLLWLLKDRPARPGAMVCLFLSGYGISRFIAEFFRQPDPQIGLFFGILSMGQILCLAMVLAAVILWRLLPAKSSVH